MIAGGQALLSSLLAGRMFYLQVVEADQYQMLADENRINMRLLPPPRGQILDRFGETIASNRLDYRVVMVKEQARDLEQILDRLSAIIPISDSQRARILREAARKPAFVPVTVFENLSWEEFAKINVRSPDLPGVQPDSGQTRDYPHGSVFSHVVGYVGAVTEEDLTGDPLLQLPGFKIGRAGVERKRDIPLRGRPGNSRVEVNAVGRVVRELAREDGVAGQSQILAIDTEVQKTAMQRLGGESGAVVVMDIHRGDVLALASAPGFDPNEFNVGLTQDRWNTLSKDPYHPLINKAIAGQYPPGSTFKPIVALAALSAGTANPEDRVYCRGKMRLGNAEFHCWKKEGHGSLDMVGAMAHSCDIYFYEMARRTGVDRIAEMSLRFGLGKETGLELSGESKGVVPTAAWKRATTGVSWQGGETLILGIGQGFLLTTPLQLAVMTARLANGGYGVAPHLLLTAGEGSGAVRKTNVEGELPWESLGVEPKDLDVVLRGMNAVSNQPWGTAFRARITEKGYSIAGKTGTAQVRRISKAERDKGVIKNEDKPWIERDHALFIGYGPVDAPRYAVSVLVEHGGGGSAKAAPIARDVLLTTLKRDPASKPSAATRIAGGNGNAHDPRVL